MKRLPLFSAILTFILLFVSGLQAAKPNVVLIITDDQGYGDVGVHGNEMIQTPSLDALYKQSVHLTDFHVDPTCSPTRSALMSGRYSTRTGVWHTIMGRSLMSTHEWTVAEVFQANGYQTGMFGKWHLGDNYPLRPLDQGFSFAFNHGGGGVGQGPDYWGNDYFDDTYWRNAKPEATEGYCTDVWFDNAIDYIREHKDEPFFVYLSTNAPHGPYLVDEKYSKPYEEKGVAQPMAKFYGMITNIDENVGRLDKELHDLGLANNTILIFMTDNGSAAGWRAPKNAKWPGFNSGMRGGKGSEYDGGHRVPFFIRWPDGKLEGGRDVNQLSAHIDVLPTLTDLCDIKDKASKSRDGVSLARALAGNNKVLQDRTILVHSQRVEYPQKLRKCSVMTSQWRLVNGKELFDIKADPGQQQDVSEEHPEVVKQLQQEYENWWTGLSTVFDDFVRIGLGSHDEPESLLHSHDWHTTGNSTPWHQNHVRNGTMGTGYWAVDVTASGKYQIELRRWPRQEEKPLEAIKASIKIGDYSKEVEVAADQVKVVFEVELPKGPADLESLFTLENGKQRGAYFAYIRRID